MWYTTTGSSMLGVILWAAGKGQKTRLTLYRVIVPWIDVGNTILRQIFMSLVSVSGSIAKELCPKVGGGVDSTETPRRHSPPRPFWVRGNRPGLCHCTILFVQVVAWSEICEVQNVLRQCKKDYTVITYSYYKKTLGQTSYRGNIQFEMTAKSEEDEHALNDFIQIGYRSIGWHCGSLSYWGGLYSV